MELDEVLKNRKSCRQFNDRRIPFDTFDAIQWAGASAPYASGGPRRNTHIIFDPAQKLRMRDACYNQEYVADAGAVFVLLGTDTGAMLSSGHPKYVFDCAAAAMCMDLMAVSLGLATCWIGHFDWKKVKKVCETEHRPTIILLVGYRGHDGSIGTE